MTSVIKTRVMGALFSAFFFGTAFAGTAPLQIAFQEGEQFNVSLSRLNYNRIFVEGEKIISTSYPEGTVIMDKSDMENPNSLEESAYLKPRFDEPLTIFFTTDKQHHFSLTIKSDESAGKTVRLIARQPTSNYLAKASRNPSEIEEVMSQMQEGEIPKDFAEARVLSRPFYVKKDIKVSLEKRYEGERLTGYVYRLENKASRPIELSTQLFDRRNAESLALSEDALAPKQVAYLYGLYRHEG